MIHKPVDKEPSALEPPEGTKLHGNVLLGQQMLSEGGPGGIAVMTQVGEMSLNVTFGAMVSDLCPVDRLAQRTGRLTPWSACD